MKQVKQGDTIKVHYTGTLEDGSVFDTSQGREPLEFTVGSGQVIVGFDEAVTGMSVGERKTVAIPCDKAYGEFNSDLVMTVPVEHVPGDLKPEVGMRLEVGGTQGEIIPVTVVEINKAHIILDANPPLAGKDLTFALELVDIG